MEKLINDDPRKEERKRAVLKFSAGIPITTEAMAEIFNSFPKGTLFFGADYSIEDNCFCLCLEGDIFPATPVGHRLPTVTAEIHCYDGREKVTSIYIHGRDGYIHAKEELCHGDK